MSLKRFLSALLVAALALSMPLAALAEALPGEAEAPLAEDVAPYEEEVVSEPVEAQPEAIILDGSIDPWAEPAEDAGDTGLSVELEEDGAWDEGEPDEIDLPAWDEEEPEPQAQDAPGDGGEEAAEEGAVLAGEGLSTGYAAVAMGAVAYADAALTQPVAEFADGGAVYAEAVEEGGTALRIRYDTDDARAWALDIPTGYILAEETLAYTEEESAALAAALLEDAGVRKVGEVPIPWIQASPLAYAVSAEDGAEGLNVAYRTQAEIQAFEYAHPTYRYQVNLYSVAPTDEPYAVGYLSPVNQLSALNMINQTRYIAGLDGDVSLYGEVEYMMAAASLVLRLYGRLSHYPPRADALSDSAYDALYRQGYTGAGRANIAMGYTVTSAILAYLADADTSNREHLGHRRWILNPTMGRTVFGANGRFSAMYAHDRSAAGGQTKVAWPAQEMPLQYFSAGDPWSVSYGVRLDASQVSVDLVRQRDGRSWHFSPDQSDGYFNVDNAGYGQTGCVIFQPAGLDEIAEEDAFNVAITTASGVTRYTVHFFNLDRSASTPLNRLDVTATKTDGGVSVSWSEDSRATGYYVCRLNDSGVYQIIADISGGTSYLDTDVTIASGLNYQYRVYAHTDSLTSISAADVKSARAADSVTMNASGTVTLYTNATLQLTGSFAPAYADTALTWDSSNKKVATVDENGLVTPVKKGTTIISVSTDNGIKAKLKVKVAAPPKPTKVTLDRSGTVKLKLGNKLTLNPSLAPEHAESALSWTTSNRKVAKVNAKGVVTPVKAGTAVITVKTQNGKTAQVKVKVVDPTVPTKVKLDAKGTVKLGVKEKLKLNATISPDTASGAKLTWSSSNKRVAKVNAKGVVTGVKKGTATITVKTQNGKTAKVKVKVG